MNKSIDISDETYLQLEQQAKANGLTISQFISRMAVEAEKSRIDIAVERMRARGLLLMPAISSQSATARFEPIQVQGKPLSEVIIEERR